MNMALALKFAKDGYETAASNAAVERGTKYKLDRTTDHERTATFTSGNYLTSKATRRFQKKVLLSRAVLNEPSVIRRTRDLQLRNSLPASLTLESETTIATPIIKQGFSVDGGVLPAFLQKGVDRTFVTGSWGKIRAAVAEWASLEADWDGNDAAPLNPSVLRAVRRFIVECEARKISEPIPSLFSDGEVGFHWAGNGRAAISFLPDERFLAYVDRDGIPPVRISAPIDVATASNAMFVALGSLL